MNFIAYSEVDFLSAYWLVDLVSSVGLYDSKSKGYDNFIVFRFQVKGLVFALGTNVNGDSSYHPIFQMAVFRCSRGCSSEKLFYGQVPRPSSFALSFSTIVMCCEMQ